MCSDVATKKCNECKAEKRHEAFAKKNMKGSIQIYESKCKECRSKYFKERREKKLETEKKLKRKVTKSPYQTQIEIFDSDIFCDSSLEVISEWIRKFKLKRYLPRA